MNKKLLVLCLLFCASEIKPFGFLEFFALIGFGAVVKTKPVQKAVSTAWSKFMKSQNVQIPALEINRNMAKFDQGSMQRLRVLAFQAREFGLQSGQKFAAVLTAMQKRAKELSQASVEQTKTTIHAKTAWKSYEPSSRSTVESAQAGSCQFTEVHAQQIKSEASGFFPRIINNYYSYKPEEVNHESGKKMFWKGAFGSCLLTAWVLKPTEQKKEKKV